MFLNLSHSLLMKLPPETAHNLGLSLMRLAPVRVKVSCEGLAVATKFGRLNNPVGLAAGFDKTGKYVKALQKLGFGYVVAGSVTRKPRAGSPRPRMVRRNGEKALVNAMGFPNPGLEQFVKNVEKNHSSEPPMVISVADENPDYLVECYQKVQKIAAAVEVNISSPNTPQLRHYFDAKVFRNLSESLKAVKSKPTYLKIPPQATHEEKEVVQRVVKIWYENGFDGVVAVNALLVDEPRVAVGRGGLSGRPLFPYMIRTVKETRAMVDEEFEIHAVGGVSSGKDVYEALRSGANTVQIYTALVYRGPSVVAQILRELKAIMEQNDISSLEQIRILQ